MSSPYYQFANTRMRFPGIDWNAGSGGVQTAAQSGGIRGGLGMNEIPNLEEMTLGTGTLPYPPLQSTIIHNRRDRRVPRIPMGNTIYPAGPEALDPNQDTQSNYFIPELSPIMSFRDSLGDITIGGVTVPAWALGAAAIAGAWWLWKKKSKRKNPGNPSRVRYKVFVGNRYAMSFRSKGDATAYASSLRRSGQKARVRKS